MTDKQKLKSLKQKMERIAKNNPEVDFKIACRKFSDIQRYYELEREHFFLVFEMEYCQTCGKKLDK